MGMHMLDIMFAPTDRLTVMLMPSWADMDMGLTALGLAGHGAHAHEHESGGLGDLGLHALVEVGAWGAHRLHLGFGVSAPVGADSHGHVPELLREQARRQGRRLPFLGLLHRIDAATSGCLCFALNKKAQEILGVQFAHHAAERRYRALVLGGPLRDADTLTGSIGRGRDGRRRVVDEDEPGKTATTHFEVLRRLTGYSDVACRLETGRTHQIRVHLAAIGCPVLGDLVYGPRGPGAWAGAPRVRRLMLHAEKLIFDHPTTGVRTTVTAPLPAHIALIDDVVTTGSTVLALATTLRREQRASTGTLAGELAADHVCRLALAKARAAA